MSSQRYERVRRQTTRLAYGEFSTNTHVQVAGDDRDEHDEHTARHAGSIPNSPPPSFRSRASSRRLSHDDRQRSEEERNLNDAFDAPSDNESDDDEAHDQRRLISDSDASAFGNEAVTANDPTPPVATGTHPTQTPSLSANQPVTARMPGGALANDGVFANLNAKPRAGDDLDEKPPTYEQAAADATPPYWETTVLSPYATTGNPDDVFVDGLLVGSFFSFFWNTLISMSFQLIGFLLTYLLHTTHAAKHGSRAGLGITLIQYGFQMRYAASQNAGEPGAPAAPVDGVPDDPNSHNFDPDTVTGGPSSHGMTPTDWLSYALMIVGWFILIRAVSNYLRARRQEALVRSSPDRGLGVAVVAEGEQPESSV